MQLQLEVLEAAVMVDIRALLGLLGQPIRAVVGVVVVVNPAEQAAPVS